ncbi:MAG: YHYH protein [Deltaproteobacteria bacterium]|nr:YHYH protein [Deltaproteobacteria bacterium]
MDSNRTLLLLTLLGLSLGAPGCVPNVDDDDDDDDTSDDDAADCWQAATILDVTNAAGAGGDYPPPELTAECVNGELVVTGNGIPTYQFVALTPAGLTEVAQSYRVSLDPQIAADGPTNIPLLGRAGFAVNGLPWFGPNEAAFPDPYGDPVYNGIVDGCAGHTAMEYHNHALVQKCLVQSTVRESTPWTLPDPDPTVASPIIGWALDGFPIFGPFGCLDSACEEVVEMNSSWNQTGDPSTYAWDNHEYVERTDPSYLDRCNGRVQPDGAYGYHATSTFPYILGCYMGTPEGAGAPGDDDDDDEGPTACDDPAECVGECPPGALGCTCADAPGGDGGICVPTCVTDADCEGLPGGPPGGLTCEENLGICVPANGGGPPM